MKFDTGIYGLKKTSLLLAFPEDSEIWLRFSLQFLSVYDCLGIKRPVIVTIKEHLEFINDRIGKYIFIYIIDY